MTYPNARRSLVVRPRRRRRARGDRHRARAPPDARNQHRLPAARQRRADRLRRRDAAVPPGEHRHQRLRSVPRQRSGVSLDADAARVPHAVRQPALRHQRVPVRRRQRRGDPERRVLVLLPAGLSAGAGGDAHARARARRGAWRQTANIAATRARCARSPPGDLHLDLSGYDPADLLRRSAASRVPARAPRASWPASRARRAARRSGSSSAAVVRDLGVEDSSNGRSRSGAASSSWRPCSRAFRACPIGRAPIARRSPPCCGRRDCRRSGLRAAVVARAAGLSRAAPRAPGGRQLLTHRSGRAEHLAHDVLRLCDAVLVGGRERVRDSVRQESLTKKGPAVARRPSSLRQPTPTPRRPRPRRSAPPPRQRPAPRPS